MKIIPVTPLWTKPINSQQLHRIPTVLTNTLQKTFDLLTHKLRAVCGRLLPITWPPNSRFWTPSTTRCGGSYNSVCTTTTRSRTWVSPGKH